MSTEKDWPNTSVTFTADGAIPHLLCHTAGGQQFLAPVRLKPTRSQSERTHPETCGRKHIYALPGGEAVIA
jgi:hypothetical protein